MAEDRPCTPTNHEEPPERPDSDILHDFLSLSTNTHVTQVSQPSDEANPCHKDDDLAPFRKIGRGSFGSIFALPRTNTIFKRETNPGASSFFSIADEHRMHQSIQAAFDRWNAFPDMNVYIPKPEKYIPETDTAWWSAHGQRFPEQSFHRPAPMIEAERIPSLPQRVRHALLDQFSPSPKLTSQMKQNPEKHDICLIRVYLGRPSSKQTRFFQITNFPLHVDQMRLLGLDTHAYARQIGRTLALIHWEAPLDARDVEFVLGGGAGGRLQQGQQQEQQAHAQMYCLDFNQCRPVSDDEEGFTRIIDAFFANDPYFPRPDPDDPSLWNAFIRAYDSMCMEIEIRERMENQPDDSLIGPEHDLRIKELVWWQPDTEYTLGSCQANTRHARLFSEGIVQRMPSS